MSRIVIALGGNALGNSPEEQLQNICKVTPLLTKLIEDGNKIVITHGNGPQVGQIAEAFESSPMPFPEYGSMSQGYIGYQLQQKLEESLKRKNINKDVLTIITQTLVDKDDPSFNNLTKPIGPFYSKEEKEKIEKEKGYIFKEDSGRGYRRVVASPKPIDILEQRAIKENLDIDNIVIAAGGGGVPVIKKGGDVLGIDAVVDKDLTSSLLAKNIDADILLILTSVDKVYLNYNKENQKSLDKLTIDEAENYIKEGQFAKGSMLPKVEACVNFAKYGKVGIITSINDAEKALQGQAGTIIGGN